MKDKLSLTTLTKQGPLGSNEENNSTYILFAQFRGGNQEGINRMNPCNLNWFYFS